LDSQPFIPSYFGYNVDINKSGAQNVRKAKSNVAFGMNTTVEGLVVDTRKESDFKNGHLPRSINIQASSEDDKFETWLGSIVEPKESFHLVIENPKDLNNLLARVSKIGYETQLKSVITLDRAGLVKSSVLDLKDFKNNPSKYTIVDIRNQSEINDGKFFEQAIPSPLNELRNSINEIPTDKPIVVHCAGGYRSAAGSSILERQLKDATVFDLSEAINDFK
jgi:rhodanese-related sulfurtransferase